MTNYYLAARYSAAAQLRDHARQIADTIPADSKFWFAVCFRSRQEKE